jgi:GNAT superfamily N-acetyltransferase
MEQGAKEKEDPMSGAVQNMLRTCWSRFVNRTRGLRRRPLLVNLRSLLQRIPFKPLDINCLYFLEYVGIPPQHANFLRGRAEVRSATLQDLEGLTKCQNKLLTFLKRFKSDDYCVVAVLDGRIVGHQWFCDKPFHVEEVYSYKIEVPPDAIYAYDIFILPEHRLAGIWFKFHCLYLRELMQKLQRHKIIGMVEYGSRLSMNTHLRFGFKLFRRVLVIKMFGKSMFIRRTFRGQTVALPRWISFAENAVPRGPKRAEVPPARTKPTIGSVHTTNAPKQR